MLRVVVLFFASLQICTNFNSKTIAWAKYESSNMDFAKKTFLSAPANRQLLAQRAMRLVTRIDISTCRCVNIFTVGQQTCQVPIPVIYLQVLNINCRELLGCSETFPSANFGICCNQSKFIKPHVTPAHLTQLLKALNRFDSRFVRPQQCMIPKINIRYVEQKQETPKIYVTPRNPSADVVATAEDATNKSSAQKKNNALANDVTSSSPIDNKRGTLAPITVEQDLIPDNIKSQTNKNEDFNDKATKLVVTSNAHSTPSPVFKENTQLANITIPTSPIVSEQKTSLMEEEEVAEHHRITNHRAQGEKANVTFKASEPPFWRHTIPGRSGSFHLIKTRRDPQFYDQLNTDSKKNLNAEKPRQQTNDGRLYNFTAFTQNGANLNMEKQIEKTEQEEFDNDHLKTASTIDETTAKPTKYTGDTTVRPNVMKIAKINASTETPKIKNRQDYQVVGVKAPGNPQVTNIENPQNKNIIWQPARYPNYEKSGISVHSVQPSQTPSLLDNFQSFLTSLGKSAYHILG